MANFPLKTASAIVLFAAFMLAAAWIPGLHRFASAPARAVAGIVDFRRPQSEPVLATAPEPVAPESPSQKEPTRVDRRPVILGNVPGAEVAYRYLYDRSAALDPFFQALKRAQSGEGFADVLHFGDSPVTADQITADMRSILQQRFGDAGHGFILMAKPWAWYGHRGVDLNGKGWKIEAASQGRAKDNLHGLGGVSFTGYPGAVSKFKLVEDHDRVEVFYLRKPGGGTIVLTADGQRIGELTTDGSDREEGFMKFSLPSGARNVEMTVASGEVRVFGVSFEKDAPGVRYHSLGLNGGQVFMAVRYFEPSHWSAAIRHVRPDLIVINYGTNESSYAEYIEKSYASELRELIRRVRNAAPDASVLIMSPMDRGQRTPEGDIATLPALPRLVEIQRRVAADMGCAFFDTFHAMGGEGTMGRWYEAKPRLVSADFMHPFPAGAKRVATLLEEALYHGYGRFKDTGTHISMRRVGTN